MNYNSNPFRTAKELKRLEAEERQARPTTRLLCGHTTALDPATHDERAHVAAVSS